MSTQDSAIGVPELSDVIVCCVVPIMQRFDVFCTRLTTHRGIDGSDLSTPKDDTSGALKSASHRCRSGWNWGIYWRELVGRYSPYRSYLRSRADCRCAERAALRSLSSHPLAVCIARAVAVDLAVISEAAKFLVVWTLATH